MSEHQDIENGTSKKIHTMKTVTAQKGQYGQWIISGVENGNIVEQWEYYGMTLKRAVMDFLNWPQK